MRDPKRLLVPTFVQNTPFEALCYQAHLKLR
jgi:hypothetical protein